MSTMIFVESLPMWRLSLFGQPSRPVLEELRSRGNEMCYHRRQLCGIPDTESETDSFEGDRIEVDLVLCTMASYAAADCHFLQDAHRRMA